jgi:hypothetical protein
VNPNGSIIKEITDIVKNDVDVAGGILRARDGKLLPIMSDYHPESYRLDRPQDEPRISGKG